MDFALGQLDLMEKIGHEVEIARNKKNFAKVIDQINTMTTAIMEHYEIDSLDDQWKPSDTFQVSHWLNHISYWLEDGREYDWEVLVGLMSPEDPDESYLCALSLPTCRDDEAIYNERGEHKKLIYEAVFGLPNGRYVGRV